MKKFFHLLLFFIPGISMAQTGAYSLKQCIEYALQNQASVKNARLDVNIAQARIGEIRSIGLPQINGAVSLVDNIELRRLFMANDPGNPFFMILPYRIMKCWHLEISSSSAATEMPAPQLVSSSSMDPIW